jgi:hypothetical protein
MTFMLRFSSSFLPVWQGCVYPMGVYAAAANSLWQRVPGLGAMRVVAAILMCGAG